MQGQFYVEKSHTIRDLGRLLVIKSSKLLKSDCITKWPIEQQRLTYDKKYLGGWMD